MGGGELSQDDIDSLLSGDMDFDMGDSADEDDSMLDSSELAAVLGGETGNIAAKPMDFKPVTSPGQAGKNRPLDFLYDVTLTVRIELGRCYMIVDDILKLGEGSVVELDKLAGDPVDVLVNNRLVARGEVLVLNDQFCVRITDIISPKARVAAMSKDG